MNLQQFSNKAQKKNRAKDQISGEYFISKIENGETFT